MLGRHQLAVASPVGPRAIARGLAGALGIPGAASLLDGAREALRAASGARRVVLTDSGTGALVLALRMAARGRPAALPGYGCIDLAAAAERAGLRVLLYDVDPRTLSPDLGSLEGVLAQGAACVVVAHLFGVPADVPAVAALAARHGATVVEDAAQGAGARLAGRAVGTLGALVVRSFGRGKGTAAGRGGALLGFDAAFDAALDALTLGGPGRGLGVVAATAAQWALGRPSVYAIPASVPGLRLGEMVYHPAGEPASLARAAAAMLPLALAGERASASRRAGIAAAWDVALPRAGTDRVSPVDGAEPGWLRYPVIDPRAASLVDARLGVVRPYPVALDQMAPLAPLLAAPASIDGARALVRTLVALPTHHFVAPADVARVAARFGAGDASRAPALALA